MNSITVQCSFVVFDIIIQHSKKIMVITERKISKDMCRSRGTALLATLLCLVSLWSCTTHVQTEDAQQEVLAAHEKRRAAMLNGDADTIDSLMTDDFTFTHANAVVETKEQFVDALKTRKLQYKTLTDEDWQVRIKGSTGVVSGTSHIVVDASGTEHDLRVRFTELWVKEDDSWRMMLLHATEVQ
jgi:ketosteroid isomerase-like protein